MTNRTDNDYLMRDVLRGERRVSERIIVVTLFVCGAISIATTLGIVWELGKEALLFFADPLVSFWNTYREPSGNRRPGHSGSGR